MSFAIKQSFTDNDCGKSCSRCYLGNCGGGVYRNSTCSTMSGCWQCRGPYNKCEGCEQYANLTNIYEPPTSVNVSVSSQDPSLFDLSGGMSIWNAHFRPTVVIPYDGKNRLPTTKLCHNNFTKNFS